MREFNHHCPYCGTQLSVKEIEEERTAAKCPHCANTIILLEHGSVMKKPVVYRCPKCNEELIYEQRPPFAHCDNCHSVYLTSEQGYCLIDPDLYSKGEKGELPFVKKRDNVVALKNKWRMMPAKTKGGIAALIIAVACMIVGAYIYSLPAAIETTKAFADMENVWKEFRDKNPYNIQIEGLKCYDDNSYVAIISEPCENVTEAELERFFKSYNCSFATFKKSIGYDGWLRDAVVSFNDLKKKDIPQFAKNLSKLLYGTDYKANLMDFSPIPEHTPFSSYDLNFQVTEEELRKWFVEDNEILVNIDDTTETSTLEQCLANSGMQMLLSKDPGFVVWIMDTGNQNLDDFKIMARKFSLDSDLILGAIANDTRVAIIGRERCVPIYELPPMRVETLCLLASAEDDELAQSYERTSLYAGKLTGGKDYAPIFLSPQLWHTEYGSTLNVTDQMLKSWSENGLIDYIDFDYPKPTSWAFNIGAMEDLGVSTLTYNWNTDGVGYIVDDDHYSIYAVNRTGSLPVSYIPGNTEGIGASDPVYKAEETAYDFFSNLSSPELVKVVQYAAMYQIFHNIDIKVSPKDIDEQQLIEIPEELQEQAKNTLNSIANLGKEERQKAAEDFDNVLVVDYDEYVKSNKYHYGFVMPGRLVATTHAKSRKELAGLAAYDNFISKIDTLHAALSGIKNDKTLINSLSSFLTDRNASIEYSSESKPAYNVPQIKIPNLSLITLNGFREEPDPSIVNIEIPSFSTKEEKISYVMRLISNYGYEIQHYNFLFSNLTRDNCMELYVTTNSNKCSEWIKCPTVVQSWSLVDSVNQVGGHNLNSKVSRFKVNKDLKPGQTRTLEKNGRRITEVSAADAHSRVGDPAYLRRYGRLADAHIQGKEIPIRPKTIITKDVSRRTARGFNTTDHCVFKITAEGDGFRINNGEKIKDFTLLCDEIAKQKITGENVDVLRIELEGFDKAGVKVDVFVQGMHARLRRGGCSAIPLEKYDFVHHTTKVEGEKAFITIPLKAGELQFGSTSNVVQAGFGGSTTIAPKISVAKGEVVFSLPKNKLQSFIEALKQFFSAPRGYMNEHFLNQILREKGILRNDYKQKIILDVRTVEEMKHLKIAVVINLQNKYNYVPYIQENNIA